MEAAAYIWCRRGGGMAMAPGVLREEQEEDIGSPSDSEAASTSSSESSSELADDASSSSSSSSSAEHHFEMSDLMTQLPFKRGLSRFFDGKSQSFASLAAVASLEDLAKPPRKRLKPSQSCGGGLDAHRGRVLSPRLRHSSKPKKATARAALSVLGAAPPRRPPLAARPEGIAAKFLVVN
uniref:Uncharacterized protein n=1 Tax=Leersia perrieri TaxID=77586 RepID=A0A0D9VJK8_9ORYZ